MRYHMAAKPLRGHVITRADPLVGDDESDDDDERRGRWMSPARLCIASRVAWSLPGWRAKGRKEGGKAIVRYLRAAILLGSTGLAGTWINIRDL